jgi:hypothetical protein
MRATIPSVSIASQVHAKRLPQGCVQVLIPENLDMQLRKAAQRNRISKGEWVRRAWRP